MKKAMIVLLVLVLLLTGFFFWKGGHHAVYLADVMEEWLDADDADLSMTLRVETIDQQFSLSADPFWTEYADRPLFGLSAKGVTLYTEGRNLYFDTGKAYALPELSGLRATGRRLALGLLLHGRVTRSGDIYHISMTSEDLELHVDITADRTINSIDILANLPDKTQVNASITSMPTVTHTVPREIADAIVQARLEKPMALTEPLDVLLPALEDLLPLQGELTLGVECGILDLSETVDFSMDAHATSLERSDGIVTIDLPEEISGSDPALLALLLLRNGSFLPEGDGARFEIILSAEATNQLCAALVPQIEELGIGFNESHAAVTVSGGKLSEIKLTADGEVPFLFTTIPVAFQAELTVS